MQELIKHNNQRMLEKLQSARTLGKMYLETMPKQRVDHRTVVLKKK